MSCPSPAPPPDGYRLWNDGDGAVPAEAVAAATELAFSAAPYGATREVCVAGVPLLVRVDPHTESHDASGNVIQGCFHGASVYRPIAQRACSQSAEPLDFWDKLLLAFALGATALVTAHLLTRSS